MLDHFTQKHCIYWSFRCRASIDSPAPFSQHTHTAATGKHVCEGKIARAPCSARQSPASGPALWRVKIPKQLGLLCVSVCVCVCVRVERVAREGQGRLQRSRGSVVVPTTRGRERRTDCHRRMKRVVAETVRSLPGRSGATPLAVPTTTCLASSPHGLPVPPLRRSQHAQEIVTSDQ